MFSNPDVIRRVKAGFIPVALKAASVNNPPPGEEGLLYREIGRSKPAPQGICVVNSAGKVLVWSLMFDDDKSLAGFFDYALKRFEQFPDAAQAVPAVRFMRYPGAKMEDTADTRVEARIPESHPEGVRCIGAPGFPEGTLLTKVYGRALKGGKPVEDGLRQEHYIEDRFELPVDVQEKLARASGEGRFAIPDEVAKALVSHAFLGVLDVSPLGAPGGKNDRKQWEFWGRRDGKVIRIEGTSDVGGGEAREGNQTDGRRWTNEVTLAWKGEIELEGVRVKRLLVLAEGREKLVWGNDRMLRAGGNELAQLPAGRAINLDTDVRFGFRGEPVSGREVGPGPITAGPPESLRLRMEKLGPALSAVRRDVPRLALELRKLQELMESRDFAAAEKQADLILEIVQKR